MTLQNLSFSVSSHTLLISIQTHGAFCLLTTCYLHLRDCARGRQVERLYCVWLYRVWLSCFRRRSGRELDIQRCGHEDDTTCNDQHSQQYPAASGSSCFIELLVETCGQIFICVNWLQKSYGFDNLPTFLDIPVAAQSLDGFLPNHVPHPNPIYIRSQFGTQSPQIFQKLISSSHPWFLQWSHPWFSIQTLLIT